MTARPQPTFFGNRWSCTSGDGVPLWCPGGHPLKSSWAGPSAVTLQCIHRTGNQGECGKFVFVLLQPYRLRLELEVTPIEAKAMRDGLMSPEQALEYLRRNS